MKIENSNSNFHNIENTYLAAENNYLITENAKLIAKVVEMKWLTYLNKLDLKNATKATIFKNPAMTHLLLPKVEKSTQLVDSLEFTGNKMIKSLILKTG